MICIAENSGGKGGVAGGAGANGQASQQATGSGASDYGYPVLEVTTGMTTDLKIQLTKDYNGVIPADLSSITKVEFRARPSMVSHDREIVVDCDYTPDGQVTVHLTPKELNFNNGVWYAEFLTYAKETDTVPPAPPTIFASSTQPTNEPVIITIKYSDDSLTREYAIGDADWSPYVEPITITENTSIRARAIDAAGNVSRVVSYTIANIDTIPPAAPIAVKSPDGPTNKFVVVSATFSDDSVQRLYSLDGGETWQDYTQPITFGQNSYIWFKGIDLAGNESGLTICVVDNIDTIPPEAPVAAASLVELTNQDVFVTATFSEDTVKPAFSLDGGNTWEPYTGAVRFYNNGIVLFRGTDNAGNNSAITEYAVNNIDKTPPRTPIVTADITEPTTGSVTVSAEFSGDSVVCEYSLDANNWLAYTEPIVFEQNGMIMFRALDAAGNVSDIVIYTVSNIDLEAPIQPVAVANITTPTRLDVIVSAVFGEDATICEYSLDAVTWSSYIEGIRFEQNGTVYFRSFDAAGNASGVTRYDVTNIDKVAPALPQINIVDKEPTRYPVRVLIACTDADTTLIQYKIDDSEWLLCPDSHVIVVESNCLISARCFDAAGNVSGVRHTRVDNIDLVPPEKPTVVSSDTEFAVGPITLTATYSEDTVTKQYSLVYPYNWQTYTEPVLVYTNGTYYFRGIDEAGNESDVTEFVVGNLDPTAPHVVGIFQSPSKNYNLVDPVFYATWSENAAKRYVKRPDTTGYGKYWDQYGEVSAIYGTFKFYAETEDGKVGPVREVPYFPAQEEAKPYLASPIITCNNTEAGISEDTLTAVSPQGDPVYYVPPHGADWVLYTEPLLITSNGTWLFRANDGEFESSIINVTYTNIVSRSRSRKLAATRSTLATIEVSTETQESVQEPKLVLTANYRSYLCIRKGMTGSTDGPHTITALDVRLAVMDTSPEANQLLDDLEFSDMMIYHAVERALNEWNETPPDLEHKFNGTTFPWTEHLIKGAVGYLMQEVAFRYNRNRMQYSAAGLTLDTNDKGPTYIAMAQAARQEWKNFVAAKKTELNMAECFGTFSLPYFGNRCYW